ncbi:hypothetical protein J8L88_17305 [Aquimarina sp. MMG015]|uniref:hypothetical protein n=1 Tax=unclassified Aquimarina TaxID=2627091 RepID=UPI000E508B8D|nr:MULTISPECIES: hypothetical protein [unclassified Aquimarina]AXT54526.1 hypothetical protein D1815_01730 [Aquimarina sp. AD1]MBQ4804622.1 hypothetical protein [Aquimarina sp. MMG015]RKN20215.1 hypothetical protein D7035_13470 [Aquimarina sp. AD1]
MRKVFLFLVFSIPLHLMAQQKLLWDDFTDVSFQDIYNVHYDDYFLKPTFGPKIKSYEGSKISIRGYFLDFSYKEEFFMVSRNPMSSCFFCGGAGPETIVEVIFKNKPGYKTDQIIEVTGILELNADDVDHCNYILKKATARLIQ